jgi:hypothetical protein
MHSGILCPSCKGLASLRCKRALCHACCSKLGLCHDHKFRYSTGSVQRAREKRIAKRKAAKEEAKSTCSLSFIVPYKYICLEASKAEEEPLDEVDKVEGMSDEELPPEEYETKKDTRKRKDDDNLLKWYALT